MKVGVFHASRHGATGGIAEYVAQVLRERGFEAEAVGLEGSDLPPDLEGSEAIVLGSALYYGAWLDAAVRFAESVRDRIRAGEGGLPVWIFSSGPLGEQLDDPESQPRQLPRLTEWVEPRDHRIFHGALFHHRLGFGERMVVKAVRAPEGDFRDWGAIRGWAESIADELARRGHERDGGSDGGADGGGGGDW